MNTGMRYHLLMSKGGMIFPYFTGQEFQSLLRSNGIRHETEERSWRTLFEISQCMPLESNLPKQLWTYAVQTAAQIRNRCYSKTPYHVFTGKTPNFSNMKIFGSEYYVYKQDKKKLDKYSPAYNVYYPETGKVMAQLNIGW